MFGVAIALPIVLAPAAAVGPDVAAYSRIAQDQLTRPDFWGWPEAFDSNFWAMAYPTFLAIALRVTGGSLDGVLTLQVFMSATLIFIPWLLARGLGQLARYAATVVLVINPGFWWMGTSIGYEFLLALSLSWALVLAWGVNRWKGRSAMQVRLMCLGSGLLFALALLTQTKSIVLAPVLGYLLWRARPHWAWWGGLGTLLGLAPWMIRNVLVLGSPSPFTGNGGYNLWVGNNPQALTGGSMLIAPDTPGGQSQLSAALEYIVSQPERFIDLVWSKSSRLLQPVYTYPEILQPGPQRTLLHIVAGGLSIILAIGLLLFFGARLFAKRGSVPDVTPLAIFVLVFFLSHLPFIAEPRFMTAVLPVTTTVAIATWIYLFQRRKGGERDVDFLANLTAEESHHLVSVLERQGMAVPLNLDVPSWRTSHIVESQRNLEPIEQLRVPQQACGLAEEIHSWPELRAHVLRGVVLDVDSGLVFAQDRVISQSGSGTRSSRDASFVSGATVRVMKGDPVEFDQPIAPLGDVNHHYHFMIETLPRLARVVDVAPETLVVTSAELPDRYREVINSLGLGIERVKAGSVLMGNPVVLIDQPELFWPRPSDLQLIRQRFMVSGSERGSDGRRIYINRRTAARPIAGEEVFELSLTQAGFESVTLEDLTIPEQIELFSKADLVVGTHGAGLANIAFMPSGGRVIELTSGEFYENCYRRIAAARAIEITVVLLPGNGQVPFGESSDAIEALMQII